MTTRSLAEWIKERRKLLDLTQEALAAQLGCAVSTVKKLETNKRRPSLPVAERLAKILDIPLIERPIFLRMARGSTPVSAQPHTSQAPASFRPPPLPLTPLFGRSAEMTSAQALLTRSDVRCVTLAGLPGVGKTRLALQLAADIQTLFTDGVCYVQLAPIHDPQLVLSTIAHALNLDMNTTQLLARVQSALQHRHLLLVLDNAEHLAATVGQLVVDLLTTAPALTILVTSRVVLRVTAEHVYVVPPLGLPEQGVDSVDAVLDAPACALFVQRAVAVAPQFVLTAANAGQVASICQQLDGLPLAIELCAARTNVLSPAALLARLDNRLNLLTRGMEDQPQHQRTLRSALAWSYDILTARGQALFRRLGLCVGGWTLEVAEALGATVADCESDAMLDSFTALLDTHLVQQATGTMSDPRFMMLETVRAYALEQLDICGERAAAMERYAAIYLAFAERVAPLLYSPDQIVWLGQLELEHDNFRAVLAWALGQGDLERVARLSAALALFWKWHGHYSEGRRWLSAALARPDTLQKETYIQALQGAGLLAIEQGALAEAIELLRASLVCAQEVGDARGFAYALCYLGTVEWFQNNSEAAGQYLEQGIVQARAQNEQPCLAHALNTRGLIFLYQGVVSEATAYFNESLAIYRRLGDRYGLTTVLTNQAVAALFQSDYPTARRYYEETVVLAEQLHGKSNLAYAFENVGLLAACQGEYAYAQERLEESLAMLRHIDDKRGVAHVLYNLGSIDLMLGNISAATTRTKASLALYEAQGAKRGIALCIVALGDIFLRAGELSGARTYYQQGLALARELRTLPTISAACHGLSRLELKERNLATAHIFLVESLQIDQQLADQREIASELETLAHIVLLHHNPVHGLCLLGAAAAIRTAVGAPRAPVGQAQYDEVHAALMAQLESDSAEQAWVRGQEMDWAQAVAYALNTPLY